MGLVYALIAVSIALVMLGIAVHNMIWLMIVGLLLLVATVAFTAVTTRAT